MKKFLSLLLVFAMASLANATLIDVQTDWVDVDESGTINESDLIYITIVNTGGTCGGFDLDLHVTGPGTLSEEAGGIVIKADPGMEWLIMYSGIVDNSIDQMSSGSMGQWAVGTELVAGLVIHCDGPGNVEVDLTLGGDTRIGGELIAETDLGDLTIVQVPEPMTVALLGLGGLFLRRRR